MQEPTLCVLLLEVSVGQSRLYHVILPRTLSGRAMNSIFLKTTFILIYDHKAHRHFINPSKNSTFYLKNIRSRFFFTFTGYFIFLS